MIVSFAATVGTLVALAVKSLYPDTQLPVLPMTRSDGSATAISASASGSSPKAI
jgi:hypothetical protein